MKYKLDIATHHYFPIQFIALGGGLIVLSIFAFQEYLLLSIGFFIGGLLLLTTHYRLLLDTEKKFYKEYIWLWGFRKGKKLRYEGIECIYLRRMRFNNEYGPFAVRYNASGKLYQGFIKFSNGESVFIGESIKKETLLRKVEQIRQTLKSEVKDYV